MILMPVMDRLHSIEDDPSIRHDTSGRVPDVFEIDTLYVFEDGEQRVFQTESGPARTQEFRLMMVLVLDAEGEEARQERTDDVTEALSSKRDEYLAWLADRQSCDLWDHVEGTADMDWQRTFEGRAVAVRVVGMRFLN